VLLLPFVGLAARSRRRRRCARCLRRPPLRHTRAATAAALTSPP
jgi:hypothetical protein